MIVWEVSEPSINIWLYDEPLGYQPGIGDRLSFKLSYKQRDVDLNNNPRATPNIFSIGPNWNCSWVSYVLDDGGGSTATMFVAGGGVRSYILDNTTLEYYSNTTMQRTTDSMGNLTGFIIHYANGAQDDYQFIPSEFINGYSAAFLTAKVDPFGHSTQFAYQDTGGVTTLRYVIDADGRTNTLFYINADPTLVTGVQDPFGRSVQLQYDAAGLLTNITDVAGLNSFMQYDSQAWVTNLTTPYGSTVFQNANASDNWGTLFTDEYTMVRGVKVIDAVGGTNVYMLRQNSQYVYTNGVNSAPFLFDITYPYNGYYYTTNEVTDFAAVPAGLPSSFGVDNTYMYYRDTFHWGPRQAVGLPSDLTTFAPSDFIKARMRHWLHDHSTGNLGQTLDMEQAPSPDGVNCGQTTWYCYDGQSASYTEGSDSQPAVISRVIPDGTTWYSWYQRDNWNRATNVVDTYSTSYGGATQTRTNIYFYASNGNDLVAHIGPLGETMTGYGYNANHQVTSFTNALNEVTSYTYDSQGRPISVTTPAGLTTVYSYYSTGPNTNFVQIAIDQQINRTNSYTYTNNLVYTHTDERGLTTTNTWDALNRLRQVVYPDGTFVTNSYYRLDLVRVKDRMGFSTSYGYDSLRRLITETNAVGNYTLYNYCSCGALESIRDAAGNFTYFTYDNAGDRLSTTYPDGYSVNYNYDLMGRVISTMDSAGYNLTNWYDNQGLRYTVTSAAGQMSLVAYDVEDRVTNSVDANDVTNNLSYDPLGRVLTCSYPDGGVEFYGYSFGVSGPTQYTNQIGKITLYGYDAARRKIAETNALNYVTSFGYDAAGDLLTLTDGKSQTTTWGYDNYGRVTNKVDAASNLLFLYQYDPDNRLTNRWSNAKGTTIYAYDAVGNLTKVTYPVSPSINLGYDVLNRLTNMVDAVGTTVYAYDAAGQMLSEDGPSASDTVNYTYQNRLRTAMSIQAPNASAWTQSYGYDSTRRLTGITSPAGAFSYTYDLVQLQRVDLLALPGGAYITNTFDNVSRLTGTYLNKSNGTNLDSYAYGYNQASQRTGVTRTAGDYANYTYDNIGELASANGSEAGGASRLNEQFGYAYDAAGNVQYVTNSTLIKAYTVNNLNELSQINRGSSAATMTVAGTTTSTATNVTVNGSTANVYADNTFAAPGMTVGSAGTYYTFTAIAHDVYGRADTNSITVSFALHPNYNYDMSGNLLGETSALTNNRSFAYDDENQLIGVWVANVWSNSFVYDGKLRRRIERDYIWNGSAWTQTNEVHFVYDGNNVVQERNAGNLPLVTYTRGNDLSGMLQGAGGIDGLLARTDNGQLIGGSALAHALYHADGNGNVTCLIYTNQTIAAKYFYDPFGNTISMYGALANANNYRFSSKEWNVNSGLYYYLYRFYDSNLQRLLNRDPLGERGFELVRKLHNPNQRFSPSFFAFGEIKEYPDLYEFVANNPISRMDILGLSCWCKHSEDVDLKTCLLCAAQNNLVRQVGPVIGAGSRAAAGSGAEYADPLGVVGAAELAHILAELDSSQRKNLLKGEYAKELLNCVHKFPEDNAQQEAKDQFDGPKHN
jgi:RHS repeat-associated protein